jgi:hypothetical protein
MPAPRAQEAASYRLKLAVGKGLWAIVTMVLANLGQELARTIGFGHEVVTARRSCFLFGDTGPIGMKVERFF